jgi:hypothetical protein
MKLPTRSQRRRRWWRKQDLVTSVMIEAYTTQKPKDHKNCRKAAVQGWQKNPVPLFLFPAYIMIFHWFIGMSDRKHARKSLLKGSQNDFWHDLHAIADCPNILFLKVLQQHDLSQIADWSILRKSEQFQHVQCSNWIDVKEDRINRSGRLNPCHEKADIHTYHPFD